MHSLLSGEDLLGLTLSIVSPLGKFGIEGKWHFFPPLVKGGGEILSALLFLADWRVFGGDIWDIK